jgi:hypothetical protein
MSARMLKMPCELSFELYAEVVITSDAAVASVREGAAELAAFVEELRLIVDDPHAPREVITDRARAAVESWFRIAGSIPWRAPDAMPLPAAGVAR